MIIQIDTDQCEHPNFGVPTREGFREISPEEIVRRVAEKLRTVIGAEDCQSYGQRLIFAVCVREIECWLLPLWASAKEGGRTTNCLFLLNQGLNRNNKEKIDPEDKKVPPYESASAPYKKRKTLLEKGPINPSLSIFLQELERRNIAL